MDKIALRTPSFEDTKECLQFMADSETFHSRLIITPNTPSKFAHY